MGHHTSSKHSMIFYGIKDGQCVHIDTVESGLKCGCFCSACGDTLIAKKGSKNIHHFAHRSAVDCEYGNESALHKAAKEILAKSKKMIIPPVSWNTRFSKDIILNMDGNLSEATEVTIDNVELEYKLGDIVPDVVVYSGKKEFFVEIFVTHEVDKEKLNKIKKTDVSVLQIDLSDYAIPPTKEELEYILLSGVEQKEWLYNSYAERMRNKILSVCNKFRTSYVKSLSDIKCCPLQKRRFSWRGNCFYFANLEEDCWDCKFYKGTVTSYTDSYENFILCSGQEYVSSLEDLKMPRELRYKMRNEERKPQKLPENFKKCVLCGNKLEERIGPNGRYICCSNYPKCKYVLY